MGIMPQRVRRAKRPNDYLCWIATPDSARCAPSGAIIMPSRWDFGGHGGAKLRDQFHTWFFSAVIPVDNREVCGLLFRLMIEAVFYSFFE